MKIAILTLPLHANYGGILQAYALQKVLERSGHEVVHLQPIPFKKHLWWILPFVWIKRSYRRYIKKEKGLPIFFHPKKWMYRNTDKFISKYLRLRYIEQDKWNDSISFDYDAIIFGSDQIWRPCYAIPIEKYYGSFLESREVRRIAYAASFGTEEVEYTLQQQENCSFLLSKFKTVSVREKSGVDLCKNLFAIDAKHVLDPTLLLSCNDYTAFIDKKTKSVSRGKIAVYVLDYNSDIDVIISKISQIKCMDSQRINSKYEDWTAPITERQQPPLENWLKAFSDADIIFTDSFHACVFSILFKKTFIVYGNIMRGMARFSSLLRMFGLEDRLVSSVEDFKLRETSLLATIDYNPVYDILENKREYSMNFIREALSDD